MISKGINQKDQLILQLQKQLSELKQNEKDYQDLNFLLTNLEHRYNLLNEEKNKNEIDYEKRIEMHLKTIAQIRTEKDQYKQSLNETIEELQQLKTEYLQIKDMQNENQRDFDNLRDETNFYSNQNDKLKQDFDKHADQINNLKAEKAELAEEYEKINIYLEQELLKNQDLVNEINELKPEFEENQASLKQCFSEIQNVIASSQIEEDSLLINQQQVQISSLNNQVEDLQNSLNRANEIAEHLKQQMNMLNESYQKEFQQNIALNNQINQLEDQIKQLQTELNYQQYDISHYENNQQKQQEINMQLGTEIQKNNALSQSYSNQNYEVLHGLEKVVLNFNELTNLIEQTKIISSAHSQFENDIKEKLSQINSLFQPENQKSAKSPKPKLHSTSSQVILNASQVSRKSKEQYNLTKRPSITSQQDILNNNYGKQKVQTNCQYQSMHPSSTSQHLMKKFNNKAGMYNSFNSSHHKLLN